jgi:chromosome segregation ATPase
MDTEKLLIAIKQDNEQTRRHFDVVAESLKSEIRVIAEGHGVLVEKIDGLGTRMDGLETKVDRLETKVDGLDTRMGHLETKADHLEKKVDHLDTKLDGFIVETRTNFEEVRASIKFSYAELDRRLTFLESGFKDLSSRMDSIESRQAH